MGGMSDAALPAATRPTPKIRAPATENNTVLRVRAASSTSERRRGRRSGRVRRRAPGRRGRRRRARWSPAGTSGRAGSIDDRTTPTAMTASRSGGEERRAGRRARPRSCAPTAPSVATIGATIETLPMVSALYVDVQAGRIADAREQDERHGARPGRRVGTPMTSASGSADDRADDHHPGEHDPGADHPARPGRGQGGGRPQDGGGQATDDRGHAL